MNEWISVNSRLPDFHVPIIFYAGKQDGVRIGQLYRASHKFISDGDKFHKSDVTHWQPLPEPPKQD